MFKKRIVRKLTFSVANGVSIEVHTYAFIHPTVLGNIVIIFSIDVAMV